MLVILLLECPSKALTHHLQTLERTRERKAWEGNFILCLFQNICLLWLRCEHNYPNYLYIAPVAWWLALLHLGIIKKVLGFNSSLRPFWVELTCSSCVYMDFPCCSRCPTTENMYPIILQSMPLTTPRRWRCRITGGSVCKSRPGAKAFSYQTPSSLSLVDYNLG